MKDDNEDEEEAEMKKEVVNAILKFIEQIPFYRKQLEAYKQDGNNFTFHTIDRLLGTIKKG